MNETDFKVLGIITEQGDSEFGLLVEQDAVGLQESCRQPPRRGAPYEPLSSATVLQLFQLFRPRWGV
jgi:hypothetical protein